MMSTGGQAPNQKSYDWLDAVCDTRECGNLQGAIHGMLYRPKRGRRLLQGDIQRHSLVEAYQK